MTMALMIARRCCSSSSPRSSTTAIATSVSSSSSSSSRGIGHVVAASSLSDICSLRVIRHNSARPICPRPTRLQRPHEVRMRQRSFRSSSSSRTHTASSATLLIQNGTRQNDPDVYCTDRTTVSLGVGSDRFNRDGYLPDSRILAIKPIMDNDDDNNNHNNSQDSYKAQQQRALWERLEPLRRLQDSSTGEDATSPHMVKKRREAAIRVFQSLVAEALVDAAIRERQQEQQQQHQQRHWQSQRYRQQQQSRRNFATTAKTTTKSLGKPSDDVIKSMNAQSAGSTTSAVQETADNSTSLPTAADIDTDTTSDTNSTDTEDQTVPHSNFEEEPITLPASAPLENFTDRYQFVRRKQKSNWEKARAKTSSNVQRALYGNMIITVAKLAAWISSGSSSMFSEFIHSIVDCGNQALLLLGLRDSSNVADRRHPYGYGKSVYFWALVSALGTFFLGAGIGMTHSIAGLINPSLGPISYEVWSVLAISFLVDGYVLGKTLLGVRESMPKDESLWNHIRGLRDPATLAILLEDGAACLGVVIASAGLYASHSSGMPIFDGLAGCGISALLATMGILLVRVNHRFLLGTAVDGDITEGIERILMARRSIDNIQSVQSQWTGPETFSFKAEVDFDGTFLAAQLMPRYQKEFALVQNDLMPELRVLLSWYAEDVMRAVEREVKNIESEIRSKYPGAEYIELEPMSKDAEQFAIDDRKTAQLRRIEVEALNRYLRSLYQPKVAGTVASVGSTDNGDSGDFAEDGTDNVGNKPNDK